MWLSRIASDPRQCESCYAGGEDFARGTDWILPAVEPRDESPALEGESVPCNIPESKARKSDYSETEGCGIPWAGWGEAEDYRVENQ